MADTNENERPEMMNIYRIGAVALRAVVPPSKLERVRTALMRETPYSSAMPVLRRVAWEIGDHI